MKTWQIFYRGSLSSCNYDCGYCPFAKTTNTLDELRQDERELERFAAWAGEQHRRIGILFTPWGEALIHRYYRRNLNALSYTPNISRVAIQTNLSAPLDDLRDSNRDTLALWATFHPSQTPLARFVARCCELEELGIRHTVGVVGLREHLDLIDELRRTLPATTYVWVNAFKRDPDYYRAEEIDRLLEVDPYFHWNLRRYTSFGQPCRAGETSFSVDGRGDVRRCHFLPQVIGNIYQPSFAECLKERTCTAATCGCHIGYINLPALKLDNLFGAGLLERFPAQWPAVMTDFVIDSHHLRNPMPARLTSSP